MSAKEIWHLGGTSRIKRDYFTGQIDDLRFYGAALSQSEVNATFNDDVTASTPAGYLNQVLFDEGSSVSGLTIGLEGNNLKAKVSEGGTHAEVSSTTNIRDGNWHHAIVTFGESPSLTLLGWVCKVYSMLQYPMVGLHQFLHLDQFQVLVH